jgi:hypothetical protein
MAIFSRLLHAWNVFSSKTSENHRTDGGVGYGTRPDRVRLRIANERSIISAIYTRLAIDAASAELRHVRLDDEGRYSEDIKSGLQDCLTVESNIDQAARHFRQDIFMKLFDKGTVAIVPVDTTIDPINGGFDIKSMRVGEIITWMPTKVRVSLYNEAKGLLEQITVDKKYVGIVENPMYIVMNEPSSTLQRLIRKLNLLDAVDEQTSSGKLDIIIQLPYTIKSEARRLAASQRRVDLEHQLSGSKYGIAYIDGTEKVTQLNRPAENNLLKQVEYLMNMLYAQLGLTADVMNGTADEKAMLNYNNRTIEPLVTSVLEAMRRAFLTKTARSQRQSIMAFRDPFKLVPISEVAEIADVFTRNEIASANDMRTAIGWKPSKDPKADELRNSNMPDENPNSSEPINSITTNKEGNSQNGS